MLIGLSTLLASLSFLENTKGAPPGIWLYGISLSLSPLLSWIGFVIGGVLYKYAIDRQMGGWMSAVCIGVSVGTGFYLSEKALFDATGLFGLPFFVFHGALASGLFWLLLRTRALMAFVSAAFQVENVMR